MSKKKARSKLKYRHTAKGNIIVGTKGEDTVDAVNFYILYLSI